MKKYFILGLAFLFLFLLLNAQKSSYAYVDCSNVESNPYVTTLELNEYLKTIDYNEIIGFCSYDKCYDVREANINKSIINFRKLYDKTLTDDELLEVNVKGYPVTKLVINNC